MKKNNSLILFLLVLLLGVSSAQTLTITNDIEEQDASLSADIVFQTNPLGFNLTTKEGHIFLKPLFNSTSGIITADQFKTNFATSLIDGYIVKGSRLKWALNLTINTASARTNLRTINFEIIYSKDFNTTTDGNRIYFKNGYINFDDLALSGFPFKIINSTMISISNVTSKVNLFLDPTVIIYSNGEKMVYDSYVANGTNANSSWGGATTFAITTAQAFLAFNTSKIPKDAVVTFAGIYLFRQTAGVTSLRIRGEEVMANWTEGQVNGVIPQAVPCGITFNYTCYNNSVADRWFTRSHSFIGTRGTVEGASDIGGGTIYNMSMDGSTATNYLQNITNANITDLAQRWVNGSKNWTTGIMFWMWGTATNFAYDSSESTTYARRPYLRIEYTIPINLTIANSTSTTQNTPITIIANFSDLVGNQIYGGRYLNISPLYSGGTTPRSGFRFTNFTSAKTGMDYALNARTTGTRLHMLSNGTQLSSTTGTNGYSVNEEIDYGNDGISEMIYSAGTNIQEWVFNNGTIFKSINNGLVCPGIAKGDYNRDGIEDVGIGCRWNASGLNAFTAYNASNFSNILWKLDSLSTDSASSVILECKFAKNMYGNRDEVGCTIGSSSGTHPTGIVIMNASNGARLYDLNRSTSAQTARSLSPVDINKVGYYNAWAYITSAPSIFLGNSSSKEIWNLALITAGSDEIVVADLNGDGFQNEIVYYANGVLFSRQWNADNSSQFYWNFTHPNIYSNRSGTGTNAGTVNMYAQDIDGDNSTEIVFVGASGWVFVLSNNGTLKVAYESGELGYTTTVISGLSPSLDIGQNTSDYSHAIGWTTSDNSAAQKGRYYIFEVEPCKISFPTGQPLRTMTFNRTTNSWYYYNSSGLPNGDYNYTVYCDGNFTGYGQKQNNGSLSFSAGGAPSTISFTVLTLGGGGNLTNSTPSTPYNTTEPYYFNSTGCAGVTCLYREWIYPCANADWATNCQQGMNRPLYSVVNTGTVDIKFYMKLSAPMANSGILLCANSSGEVGVTGAVSTCSVGNLNDSLWLPLATAIQAGKKLNITVYANFSATLGGIYSTTNVLNSTA